MPLSSRLKPLLPNQGPFVAIDFETADYGRDSACAIGLVRVEGGQIVRREAALIRPPRSRFVFSYVHGITWQTVAQAPEFADVWQKHNGILEGATFLAAHNASFDRDVLNMCCTNAGLPIPSLPFVCRVQLAKRRWGQKPNDLPSVCRRLGIGLVHHDPGSDAEACAKIVIAALVSSAPATKRKRSQIA